MQIELIPQALLLCREARICSFLWGHRGLGKSDSHKELAYANKWGFIDLRGSQIEGTDIRGMPDKVDGMTTFLAPSELPRGHDPDEDCPACSEMTREDAHAAGIKEWSYCKGLLFLDEINRAEDDVLQAVFQLVLDRKVGEYELPDGWSVHCAGNYGKGYNTNNFKDPAFVDRFCHLQVSGGSKYMESWIDWMMHNNPGHDKIIQYVSANTEHLIGEVPESDWEFSVQPSPRTWVAVARVLDVCETEDFDDAVRLHVIEGLVGSSHAPAFDRFSCKVTPKMIIDDGPAPHENDLNDLTRNAVFGLAHGVGSHCVDKKVSDLGDKAQNVCQFLLWLANNDQNRDMAITLAKRLVGKDSSMSGAMLSNPKLISIAQRYKKKLKKADAQEAQGWMAEIHKFDELREMMQKVTWGGVSGDKKKG